jgi:hypothetical protein
MKNPPNQKEMAEIIAPDKVFDDSDDFYNVSYFIVNTCKINGVGEIGDVPQQIIKINNNEIPVPCANPSICAGLIFVIIP